MRTLVSIVMLLFALDCTADPFAYAWEQVSPSVWAGIRADPFELPQEGNAVIVLTTEGAVLFDAGGSPAMGEAIVAKVRALTDRDVTDVVMIESAREIMPDLFVRVRLPLQYGSCRTARSARHRCCGDAHCHANEQSRNRRRRDVHGDDHQ